MSRAGWMLLILGLAQMAGELLGLRALKGIAAATAASPAPKVFSAVRGFETFSVRYILSWDENGVRRVVPLSSELYARLPGPYNLRNVYGAALAYGPVLPEELRAPVTRFAFCGERPLLRRLGFDPERVGEPIRVEYEPRPGAAQGDWPLAFELRCP